MSEQLIPREFAGDVALGQLADRVHDYARQAKAAATRRAYAADLRDWAAWCEQHRVSPLPAEPAAICLYLAHLAGQGRKASTIQRRLAAISQAHQAQGCVPSPAWDWRVRQVMSGIRRELGIKPQAKRALTLAQLRRLLQACVDDMSGHRDRALLPVGLGGGFRRSELVSLRVEDLEENEEGLVFHLGRSKTDPEGVGHLVGIVRGQKPETCPVRALRAWLERAAIAEGRSSVRSTATADYSLRWVIARSRWPSSEPAGGRGWIRSSTPVTRCARAMPPQPPAATPPNGRSCAKPATARSSSCAATSRRARSSRKTPRPTSGF